MSDKAREALFLIVDIIFIVCIALVGYFIGSI